MKRLKTLIPDRIRYGKGYVLEKKLSKISKSYNIKEYDIRYAKSIRNIYRTFESPKYKEFIIRKSNHKKLVGKDSREVIIRGVYSLFSSFKISDNLLIKRYPNKSKKEINLIKNKFYKIKFPVLAIEVLDSITKFIESRRVTMQSKYFQKFSEIFYELLIAKDKNQLVIEGNNFFISVFNKLNEINKNENLSIKINNGKVSNLNPVFDYVSYISNNFLDYVSHTTSNRKKKYVTVKEVRKEKFSINKIKNYILR
jgi:hypothetical protein